MRINAGVYHKGTSMIRLTLPWTKSFGWLVVLVGLAPSAFGADQSRPTLEVIPRPREIKFAGAAFEPASAKVISVSDSRADRFAARLLQEALRETHGVDGDVLPSRSRQRTFINSGWD